MVFEVSNLTRKNAQPDFIQKMLENIFLTNHTLMNLSKVTNIAATTVMLMTMLYLVTESVSLRLFSSFW